MIALWKVRLICALLLVFDQKQPIVVRPRRKRRAIAGGGSDRCPRWDSGELWDSGATWDCSGS